MPSLRPTNQSLRHCCLLVPSTSCYKRLRRPTFPLHLDQEFCPIRSNNTFNIIVGWRGTTGNRRVTICLPIQVFNPMNLYLLNVKPGIRICIMTDFFVEFASYFTRQFILKWLVSFQSNNPFHDECIKNYDHLWKLHVEHYFYFLYFAELYALGTMPDPLQVFHDALQQLLKCYEIPYYIFWKHWLHQIHNSLCWSTMPYIWTFCFTVKLCSCSYAPSRPTPLRWLGKKLLLLSRYVVFIAEVTLTCWKICYTVFK